MPDRQGGRSLDAHKLDAAYTGFHTGFFKSLATAPTVYDKIADVVEDDRPINVWNWISNVPKMRKWIGNKRLHKLRAEKKEMRTEEFEASIQVPKRDIIEDRLGIWRGRINEMGRAYPLHLDDMVIDYLVAGFSDTRGRTYDGQYLLDTDHTADGGNIGPTQSNLVTGALTRTTYRTAYKRMAWDFLDDAGERITNRPRWLVVGPQHADTVRDILEREWISDGVAATSVQIENLTKRGEFGVVTPIVTPRITGLQWFLLADNPKAIILQRKRGPDFYSVGEDGMRGGPTNLHTFMTGNVLYGIESEEGCDYGAWQDVVGGPGT